MIGSHRAILDMDSCLLEESLSVGQWSGQWGTVVSETQWSCQWSSQWSSQWSAVVSEGQWSGQWTSQSCSGNWSTDQWGSISGLVDCWLVDGGVHSGADWDKGLFLGLVGDSGWDGGDGQWSSQWSGIVCGQWGSQWSC